MVVTQGFAAPTRVPRGQLPKKMSDPVIFRWDDSAAVTATALACYAAEHAEALKKPRLPARIAQFLNEPRLAYDASAEPDPDAPPIQDGHGSRRFEDGSLYTGQFVNGEREGHGRYRSSLGAVYEGEWVAGQRCGKGMERYPIGNVYEGQFTDDKRDGLGTMWYPGGDTYEGFYKAGKKEGRGKYRSASGALYEGEYRADLREGQGKERYPDGSVYEGGFREGKRAGMGTMRYASGDVYVGPWKRDLRDGKGTFQYAGGARYEGDYRAGVMDGHGNYRFADGSLYIGDYKNGKREGRGVYHFADGAIYEGEYKNGAMEGFGTYQYIDGRAEVGRYENNVDVGEGVRWSADRQTCWRLCDGKVVEDTGTEKPARAGQDLRLTLDLRLQYLAYRELAAAVERNKAQGGMIVIAEVKTGDILAVAALPAYNPNNPEDRKTGLRNRAITDRLEPGSTIKPLMVATALETGTFKSESLIDTGPGHMQIGTWTVRDIHAEGIVNLPKLLAKSSNVGAAIMGLKMGPQALYTGYKHFGIGEPIALGFPGEVTGVMREPRKWRESDIGAAAYGYGVSMSALHLVRAYAALGNMGLMPQLSLVRRATLPEPVRAISAGSANAVLEMMRGVVSLDGTGNKAAVPGYSVAGKTGTVRKLKLTGGYEEKRHWSAFVGLIPANDPQLVGLVFVEEPSQGAYYGGLVAAPVFSAVMGGAARLLQIPQDLPLTDPGAQTVQAAPVAKEPA